MVVQMTEEDLVMSSAHGTADASAAPGTAKRLSTLEMLKLFRAEKRDPEPFYLALATRTLDGFAFPLRGRRVLDLGAGPGYFSTALAAAGAEVVALEQATLDPITGVPGAIGDGARLPFATGSFDGVFCSNVLEHTPDTAALLAEVERVVRPGGWAWVSWTSWWSPWGGHAITPLHYLGPRLGLATWRRLFGEPKGRNIPFRNLWKTTIGGVVAQVRARPGLHLAAAIPRYYPSQRWITRIPLFREVATWNCLLLIERTERKV
jgi:SAM-dependent methyltransferase